MGVHCFEHPPPPHTHTWLHRAAGEHTGPTLSGKEHTRLSLLQANLWCSSDCFTNSTLVNIRIRHHWCHRCQRAPATPLKWERIKRGPAVRPARNESKPLTKSAQYLVKHVSLTKIKSLPWFEHEIFLRSSGVWTVGPQLVAPFRKSLEPLGEGVLLELLHWGQVWGFYSLLLLLLAVSPSISCVWANCLLLGSFWTARPTTGSCYCASPAKMHWIPLEL